MPTIETSISIAAPPEQVWAILTDLGSYRDWNPFIVEGTGRFERSEKLKLQMQPPGGKPMTFRPVVLRAEPARELRWRGRLLIPGLFDGEHFFRLEPESSGTRLEHGEIFSGLMPRFMDKTLKQTEAGFVAFNEALRDRAEARQTGEPDGPTEAS